MKLSWEFVKIVRVILRYNYSIDFLSSSRILFCLQVLTIYNTRKASEGIFFTWKSAHSSWFKASSTWNFTSSGNRSHWMHPESLSKSNFVWSKASCRFWWLIEVVLVILSSRSSSWKMFWKNLWSSSLLGSVDISRPFMAKASKRVPCFKRRNRTTSLVIRFIEWEGTLQAEAKIMI